MWYNKYIGIPYQDKGRDLAGLDCWGLVYLVYKNEFNIELPSFVDSYINQDYKLISDTISENKEHWLESPSPELGSVVLFKVFGHLSHVGICIGNGLFIHAAEGTQQVVSERLDSYRWKKRIHGYFQYQKDLAALVTAAEHPFKRETFSEYIQPGTTVQDLVSKICEKHKIYQETDVECIVFVNGQQIPEHQFSETKINSGDKVEFRSLLKGENPLRTILLIAVIAVAYAYGGALGAQISNAITGATGTAAATGATVGLGYKAVGMLLINVAGMALMNVIAPIREPRQSDPGQPDQLNLFNGGSNQLNPYGAIPVVLGRIRYTPPLAAQQVVEFEDITKSKLNTLVAWGFGPLKIEDIQIGTKNIAEFTDNPKVVNYNGYASENFNVTDEIYKSDTKQYVIGNPIILQNVKAGSLEADGETNSTVLLNTAIVNVDQESDRIKIALHFPEGLRTVKVRGDGAGDISAASAVFDYTYQEIDISGNPVGSVITNTVVTTAKIHVMPPQLLPETYYDYNNAGGDPGDPGDPGPGPGPGDDGGNEGE